MSKQKNSNYVPYHEKPGRDGLNTTKSPVDKDNLEKQVKATLVAFATQPAAVKRAGYWIIF